MFQSHEEKLAAPIGAAIRRLVSLVFTPLLLFGASFLIGEVTRTPLTQVGLFVAAGATTIMATFVVFGVKAHGYAETGLRFDLGTALLVAVPLAINLTAVGWFVRGLQGQRELPVVSIFALVILMWLVVTNVMLLCLAETIVWFAARVVTLVALLRRRGK